MTHEDPRRSSLVELAQSDAFVGRHIGSSPQDQAAMLEALGYPSREALIEAVIPAQIRRAEPLQLPEPIDETSALARLKAIAARNRVLTSFIGQGYYGTITPGVIQRNVLESPSWYTAYTPYQPEIAQGRLEALINFQTMVSDLTGMAIANASMLDEATAAAEAMALALRVGKSKSLRFFVADDVFAQTLDVVRTRAAPIGVEVVTGPVESAGQAGAFAVLLQYPGANGDVRDYRALVEQVHANDGLVIVAADVLALTLLTPPGEWGADVVVGSTQRFGVPMGYGGPHAGYLATRDAFKRSLPGRLVGATIDANGDPAYRLALQTREQHIRREKATSNICTAQVLLAVIASMYAVYHGPDGLAKIARRVHRMAAIAKTGLERLGFEVDTQAFFDTITVVTSDRTERIHRDAVAQGMNFRRVDAATIGLSFDETTTSGDVQRVLQAFAGDDQAMNVAHLDAGVDDAFPTELARTSAYLTHPTFNRYRSETEMLRYLRRLADKDLALDRTMIPLGSCTMKLNATAEMQPISWHELAHLHPFVPQDQAAGYRQLVAELEAMLCECTGYDAVSLQPNAGSQGEYAGLLIIKAYHESRGEAHRNVCLIPSSAHGTNPASAQMAGMRVVVVACDDEGNVDLDDLGKRAGANRDTLAAIMVTYPSTHGVFETGIVRICEIVHANGGQVYVDGANLNALVGLAAPGRFGADVSHLNLHKTFCIPHGGGGPGVGPVAVRAHLAAYLPGHRHMPREREPHGQASSSKSVRGATGIGPVSAAPFGSASILPISWTYITMMGGRGLTLATEAAILHANYVAKRLERHYPVLYAGPNGLVAHECILDLRPLKASSGIEVEDVAKRLIDYGFHAPTMSFPVPGTLMVEPTESESKHELDRFIEAMIAIRDEIRMIERGEWARADNPLKHAPHTASAVSSDDWTHRYSRRAAAYPTVAQEASKYWPPVARVDNVYGDRNLFCSCIPVSDEAETVSS
ncbi:MAG TPA: aminomethyl-transferring glycine dehydrogenase [Casimicrobiaceae bacterium]|nr:aminomethyl-transferring glycine dehydrogenase [Casimicrobiaceae bacterium]